MLGGAPALQGGTAFRGRRRPPEADGHRDARGELPARESGPAGGRRDNARIARRRGYPRLTAFGGYVVISRRAPTGRWALEAWHEGSITKLDVPERSVPFDAEAGPSGNGTPTVVFSKCRRDPVKAGDWGHAAGCRIYELALPHGSPRLVGRIFARHASDTTPAIWKNEIAFARLEPGQRAPTLYLSGGGGLRRVGAGPTTCLGYSSNTPCDRRPKVLSWVEQMSLGAGALAYQWRLPEAIPAFSSAIAQIRVDPLLHGRQDGPAKVISDSIPGGACNGEDSGSPDVAAGLVLFVTHRSICVGERIESSIGAYELATRSYRYVKADPLAVAVAQDGPSTYWISLAEGRNEHSSDYYAESCEPALSTCTLVGSETLTGQLKPG